MKRIITLSLLLAICSCLTVGLGQQPVLKTISGLTRLAQQEIGVPQFPEPNRLWTFYYPWYYNQNRWNRISHFTDRSALGEYLSNDSRTLERHIQKAKFAGIDVFVCSWWGPNGFEDQRFNEMLSIAEAQEFQLCPYLEILIGGSTAQPDSVIQEWIDYILQEYGDHPAFAKLDGKPVIWIWASNAVPADDWKRILDGYDAKFIGMSNDINSLTVFDGIYDYNNMDKREVDRFYRMMQKSIDFMAHQQGVPLFYAPTVIPGFHKKGFDFILERNNGKTYERYWDAAMKCNPHDIVITTWNEWPEGTYIEPSQEYGTHFLELTKQYSAIWKGQ